MGRQAKMISAGIFILVSSNDTKMKKSVNYKTMKLELVALREERRAQTVKKILFVLCLIRLKELISTFI